jgi:hypothetical protein
MLARAELVSGGMLARAAGWSAPAPWSLAEDIGVSSEWELLDMPALAALFLPDALAGLGGGA